MSREGQKDLILPVKHNRRDCKSTPDQSQPGGGANLGEGSEPHDAEETVEMIIDSLPRLSMTSTGIQYDGELAQPRKVVSILKVAQHAQLRKRLSQNRIHGAFYNQVLQEGWDSPGSHLWLKRGRFQGSRDSSCTRWGDSHQGLPDKSSEGERLCLRIVSVVWKCPGDSGAYTLKMSRTHLDCLQREIR